MNRIGTPPGFWGKPINQPGTLWKNKMTGAIFVMTIHGTLERSDNKYYHYEFTYA